MEFNKIQSVEHPLLKRTDASYTVTMDGATPSRIALAQSLSTKEKGTVIITHIYAITGSQTVTVHARIYKDAAVAASVERANLIAKQQPKAEVKAAEEA